MLKFYKKNLDFIYLLIIETDIWDRQTDIYAFIDIQIDRQIFSENNQILFATPENALNPSKTSSQKFLIS